MRGLVFGAAILLGLSACTTTEVMPPRPAPVVPDPAPARPRAAEIVAMAIAVAEAIEPVAEAECNRQPGLRNCDFLILVDDRPDLPANAFQTTDAAGRPMIILTLAMLAEVRNPDELAFVLGHEAAHHIRDHLGRQQQTAAAGAVLAGGLAGIFGAARAEDLSRAQRIGAAIAARSYSKDHELEADQLGAIITLRAGFDPLKGAEFFFRLPDPGDRFLGTHPANAERYAVVQRTVATY